MADSERPVNSSTSSSPLLTLPLSKIRHLRESFLRHFRYRKTEDIERDAMPGPPYLHIYALFTHWVFTWDFADHLPTHLNFQKVA